MDPQVFQSLPTQGRKNQGNQAIFKHDLSLPSNILENIYHVNLINLFYEGEGKESLLTYLNG